MPSLFKFITTVGTLVAMLSAALFVLAENFEPESQEVIKSVPKLSTRKP